MGADSKIEWTHHTFNPWEGCQRVSPGCEHCYAEARDKRWTGGIRWGVKGERRIASEPYWRQPVKWNREAQAAGERRRVFCASLADVFEDRPELTGPRARLWQITTATPHLDWLLLTKRPENADRLWTLACLDAGDERPPPGITPVPWESNHWLGVTAENQEYADKRIPILVNIDGPAVRFVSYEPALGPVNFTHIDADRAGHAGFYQINALTGRQTDMGRPCPNAPAKIDWIIVGGESGGGARPFDLSWAKSTVAQCRESGIACFVKQIGARPFTRCDLCSEVECRDNCSRRSIGRWNMGVTNRKGGDMSEWPEDLRVREFPRST